MEDTPVVPEAPAPVEDKPMNLWFVFVGGGACGEVAAGAAAFLTEKGWWDLAKGAVGTSVGGLNACTLAKGGAPLLKKVWASIQKDEDVYTPAIPGSKWDYLNPIILAKMAMAALRFVKSTSFFDTTPLQQIVENTFGSITTDDIFKATGKRLLVRSYNYATGMMETLFGKLIHMALATSAIEGAFAAHKGHGDGGIGDNNPIDVAVKNGATHIAVFYCGPDSPEKPTDDVNMTDDTPDGPPRTGLQNIIDAANHIVGQNEELVWRICQNYGGVSFVHIIPSGDTGSCLDFKKRGLWEMGYNISGPQALLDAQVLGWKVPC